MDSEFELRLVLERLLFLNIEVKFIKHKINHLKMNNSVGCSTFTMLCKYQLSFQRVWKVMSETEVGRTGSETQWLLTPTENL